MGNVDYFFEPLDGWIFGLVVIFLKVNALSQEDFASFGLSLDPVVDIT